MRDVQAVAAGRIVAKYIVGVAKGITMAVQSPDFGLWWSGIAGAGRPEPLWPTRRAGLGSGRSILSRVSAGGRCIARAGLQEGLGTNPSMLVVVSRLPVLVVVILLFVVAVLVIIILQTVQL